MRFFRLNISSNSLIAITPVFLISFSFFIVACGETIEVKEEARTETISFSTTKNDDCNLQKGQTQIKQPGKNGSKEIRERVTYTNGKATSREMLSETITEKPIDEILLIGGLEARQEPENQPIPPNRVYRDNPNLPEGQERVVQAGKPGTQTVTYEVTYKCGKPEGEKKPVGEPKVIAPPVDEIIERGTKLPNSCDPNYSDCVPIASDVDCEGGSGNGPAYVQGPITVIGSDIYGLDRDGDGIGCE